MKSSSLESESIAEARVGRRKRTQAKYDVQRNVSKHQDLAIYVQNMASMQDTTVTIGRGKTKAPRPRDDRSVGQYSKDGVIRAYGETAG